MDFDKPPADPVQQCLAWLAEAEKLGLNNHNAMTLATADDGGRPSSRIVLLKGLDEHGAVFFTNRESRKGRDLAANPHASLLFFWDRPNRQIRIDGTVTDVSEAESDAYFATRDRGSQIGAWASRQSEPLASRVNLLSAVAKYGLKYAIGSVPRPPHWGGYRVSLERIEFWQGRDHRLHDRVVYTPDGDRGWKTQRLYP